MTKLLVLSDLHLELRTMSVEHNGARIDEEADVVVLAGDIDVGVGGMKWARENFPDKPVVYVAGNHEFYRHHWVRLVDALRAEAKRYDIHFLENDAADIAGIRFLGCTLWTDFLLFGPDAHEDALRVAQRTMTDFRIIRVDADDEDNESKFGALSPHATISRHQTSALWLKGELEKPDPTKTVIVTHHAPHITSVPAKYAGDLGSAAYASDMTWMMGKSRLWIHGHMHESVDYGIKGTRVVCNPRGYQERSGANENAKFNPAFSVEQ